ncbi:DUF3164 family protein [Nitratidesulfovibrio liaohensis]|uniref:DUF3164 family protein n=1 Tax=Nitratidesulfovibrio liaohensis TaxID=2604158 RepID=UPI0014229C39|nr:DUF3164 family protein [Nitratidesulfovibrio liaohensis]NHZ48622.1 DUF3164 family protein [Nitratidesulfovibrio liaohensis]
MSTPTNIPDGYMENAQGHLIPKHAIRPADMARNDLVLELVAEARAVQGKLADFKARAMGEVSAFVSLSAEQYGAKIGGNKGNVTLVSYDGRYKIQRSIAEHITFDERLQAAKSLIDDCLREWASTSRPELQTLVTQAFDVDSEGRINTGAILALRRYDFDDERWLQAMQAIGESIQVTGTKAYIRVYERNSAGGYDAIPLDIAAI